MTDEELIDEVDTIARNLGIDASITWNNGIKFEWSK